MKYYYSGLKDDDLVKIFNELKLVLETTSNYFKRYPPYTFTEGSNTGYLVSACGRLNFAAVQEYRTKSKINGKVNYGRGDLLVFVNEKKAYRFEAKQFLGFALDDLKNFSHIQRKRNKNIIQIEGYKEMMMKNCDNEDYISLMYIIPHIKEGTYLNNQNLEKDWEDFINALKEKYSDKQNFLVSYLNDLKSLNFIYDKITNAETAYPGLIILGDIIKN